MSGLNGAHHAGIFMVEDVAVIDAATREVSELNP